MENIVSINHTKTNVIEFDITTEGVDSKKMSAYLLVKTKDLELRFNATKKKGDTFEVKLPILNHLLEKTAYNCQIEIIADGYHFVPMKGTLNVVGSADVYTSAPKNKTLDSEKETNDKSKDDTKKKEKVKEHTYFSNPHTKYGERSIEQIANALLKEQKNTVTQTPINEQTTEPTNKNVEKINNILKEFGLTPTRKSKTKFTIKTKPLDG